MKIVEGFYFFVLNHATDHFDVFSSLSSLMAAVALCSCVCEYISAACLISNFSELRTLKGSRWLTATSSLRVEIIKFQKKRE